MYITEYIFKASTDRLSKMQKLLERLEAGEKVDVDQTRFYGNLSGCFSTYFQTIAEYKFLKSGLTPAMTLFDTILNSSYVSYRSLRASNAEMKEHRTLVTNLVASALMLEGSFGSFSPYRDFEKDYSYLLSGCEYFKEDETIDKIFSRINLKGEFNLLDTGTSSSVFDTLKVKEKHPGAKLYNVVKSDELYITDEQRALFERIVVGGFHSLKATNGVMDIVICRPEIELYRYNDSLWDPAENKTISRAFQYVRKGGVFITILPKTHISEHIAKFFATNLKQVEVIESDELKRAGGIVVMGVKVSPIEREFDAHVYSLLRNYCVLSDEQKDFPEDTYTLPGGLLEVSRFRSGTLTDSELNYLTKHSEAMNHFWKDQNTEKKSTEDTHPLLPFNVGQLGLVLTSGCLDGVVEEPGNCSHVVKGRVIKVDDSTTHFNEDNTQVEITTTTSNRVEISMFLPDGTYKCLV